MQNQNTEKSEKCLPLTIWQKLAVPFPYEDLEWRIAQAGKSKDGQIRATCFAYVSARAIQDRLDSVIGPQFWKVHYEVVPGVQDVSGGILCSLSLCVEGTWISKEDGADQTDMEKFKGGLSSALKRAAVVWGIGRYLYDLETNWATIVDRGVRGARYGQTKEKEPFYWLPPDLPEWALPKEDEKKDEHVQAPAYAKFVEWARREQLDPADVRAKVKSMFGKETSADLTSEELSKLVLALRGDFNESFDESGTTLPGNK